jgi:hypothetical protein
VPEGARDRVERLLQNLRDLTYSERLQLLLARLDWLGDEIAGKSPKPQDDAGEGVQVRRGRDLWWSRVKSVRDGFAHLNRNSLKRQALRGSDVRALRVFRWAFQTVLVVQLFRERALFHWRDMYALDEVTEV